MTNESKNYESQGEIKDPPNLFVERHVDPMDVESIIRQIELTTLPLLLWCVENGRIQEDMNQLCGKDRV